MRSGLSHFKIFKYSLTALRIMQVFDLQRDYLTYKGIFDLDRLTDIMVKWFRDRHYKFYETLYKDKPPRREIEWAAERKVDGYFMYQIKITTVMWDVENVDVIKRGEKRKMTSARMRLTMHAKIVTDYSKKWETSALLKFWERVYNKHIIRRDIEFKHIDKLYYIMYSLHELIKQTLEMETSGGAYS